MTIYYLNQDLTYKPNIKKQNYNILIYVVIALIVLLAVIILIMRNKKIAKTNEEIVYNEPINIDNEIEPKASKKIKLIYINGRKKDSQISLIITEDSSINIGRSNNNEAVIELDDSISRMHAILICSDNIIYIQDNKSSHGVYLNGVKISQAEAINHEDIITLGNTDLKVDL